jgi:hypothetical protein
MLAGHPGLQTDLLSATPTVLSVMGAHGGQAGVVQSGLAFLAGVSSQEASVQALLPTLGRGLAALQEYAGDVDVVGVMILALQLRGVGACRHMINKCLLLM